AEAYARRPKHTSFDRLAEHDAAEQRHDQRREAPEHRAADRRRHGQPERHQEGDEAGLQQTHHQRTPAHGSHPSVLTTAFARVASTMSHRAMAASDKRSTTNSLTASSVKTNLLPGVADDHMRTAASMARVGRSVFDAVMMLPPRGL